MIYVRDCQSDTGTFVNGKLVGQKPFVEAAQLLQNKDIISIGPCIIRVCTFCDFGIKAALTSLQQKEALVRLLIYCPILDRLATYLYGQQFSEQFLITNTLLGSGAFANVYLATNVLTGKQVMCKIHDLSHLGRCVEEASEDSHDMLVQRVEREMSIWSQLDHVR